MAAIDAAERLASATQRRHDCPWCATELPSSPADPANSRTGRSWTAAERPAGRSNARLAARRGPRLVRATAPVVVTAKLGRGIKGCNLAVWPARRDPFMTHAAENRGDERVQTGLPKGSPDLLRTPNRSLTCENAWSG